MSAMPGQRERIANEKFSRWRHRGDQMRGEDVIGKRMMQMHSVATRRGPRRGALLWCIVLKRWKSQPERQIEARKRVSMNSVHRTLHQKRTWTRRLHNSTVSQTHIGECRTNRINCSAWLTDGFWLIEISVETLHTRPQHDRFSLQHCFFFSQHWLV